MAKVLLADRQPLFNEALEGLLMRNEEHEVVGRCTSSDAVLAAVTQLRPDLLLIDAKLALGGAPCLLERALAQHPTAKPVVLAPEIDLWLFVNAIRAGAVGVILKTSSASTILRAVEATLDGGRLPPAAILPKVFQEVVDGERRAADSPLNRLSPREREVLALLGRGWDNAAIGAALFISPHTVRTHIENILEKLEMHSKLQAATFAMQWASELPDVP